MQSIRAALFYNHNETVSCWSSFNGLCFNTSSSSTPLPLPPPQQPQIMIRLDTGLYFNQGPTKLYNLCQ